MTLGRGISFAEVPDYSILPAELPVHPRRQRRPLRAWSTALNASSEWFRATAYPHPEYGDSASFEHDLGASS